MDQSLPSSTQVLTAAVVFEGGLGLLAIGLGWLVGRPLGPLVHWSAGALALGLAGSLPMFGVLLLTTRLSVGPLARLNRVVADVVVPMFARCSWLDFALVAVLAGVGEELLFRGVIQLAVSHWFTPATGVAVAAVLFGLAHPLTLGYAVLAALFGLYLGGLWLYAENLLVAIVAHAAYDFLALAYLVRRGS